MNDNEIGSRMTEIFRPIDEAIMMCDSNEEVLMLASVMQVALKNIYDNQLGVDGRKYMLKGMT
jgi:hypothetical protein